VREQKGTQPPRCLIRRVGRPFGTGSIVRRRGGHIRIHRRQRRQPPLDLTRKRLSSHLHSPGRPHGCRSSTHIKTRIGEGATKGYLAVIVAQGGDSAFEMLPWALLMATPTVLAFVSVFVEDVRGLAPY